MIWTPLVRRLSAIALFVIFNAAVYPFGRTDLIGHALIMAVIVAIAADHTREIHFLPALKRPLAGVPACLAAALVIFVSGYWGLHIAFYGMDGRPAKPSVEIATHSYSAEHPHGPQGPTTQRAADSGADKGRAISATAAFEQAMDRMHRPMMQGIANPDPDVAFILGMIPHHQGAVDMAEIELKYGTDHHNRELATKIIELQKSEISEMRQWLRTRGIPQP